MSEFPSFSEKDFDLKKWINETLRTRTKDTKDGAEKQASSIRLKLQHMSTELNNSIEELSGQCLLRIPRAVRDVEAMRKDVNSLAQKVTEFELKLSKLETETQESIQLVAELDNVKTKMVMCTNIINESEKYKSLVKDIEKIFEKQDSEQIASILGQLEKSISILKNIPEFSDSEQLMDKYTQRLESLIRPKLIQTFNQHSTEAAIKYASIFEQIGRKEQFLYHYYNCRSVPITQFWASFEKKPKEEQNSASFVEWIVIFYDELQVIINAELDWTSEIFNTHNTVVAFLLLRAHEEIRPNFDIRLKQEDMTLDYLIKLFSSTKDFVSNLNFLDKLPVTGDGKSTCTKKMVCSSIFSPYAYYQNEYYIKKEKEKLYFELTAVQPHLGDFVATTNNMSNSVPKLFFMCDAAVDRCIKFTEGTQIQALILLLGDIFLKYLGVLNDLLKELRNMANLGSFPTIVKVKNMDDDSHFHDWGESYFQGALQFLEIVNKLTTRLDNFDSTLKTIILRQKSTIFGSGVVKLREINELNCFHITDMKSAQKLLSFFESLEDVAFNLLAKTHEEYTKFMSVTQTFVFDTMFSYIKQKLSPIPGLEEWAQDIKGQIPEFSLSPQGYVKLVVEHLIDLRRLLEPYDSNEAMHLENTEKFHKDIKITGLEETTWEEESDPTEIMEDDGDHKNDGDHEGFAFWWILAVARATMTLYIEKILQIPRLTDYGAMQLAVDISHLCNVLKVLGVKTDPTLNQICTLVNMQTKEELAAIAVTGVGNIIGKKRGWVGNTTTTHLEK